VADSLEPDAITLLLSEQEICGLYDWMLNVGYIDFEVYPHIHEFYRKLSKAEAESRRRKDDRRRTRKDSE